jgi:hypothetical protein
MSPQIKMKAKSICLTLSLCLLMLSAISSRVQSQAPAQPYRLNDKEVEGIIRGVEKQADTFRQSLRAALNQSHFNGSRSEDDINSFVRDFDRETRRLHDHFDQHKSTGADIQSVLDRAAAIDRFMIRNRLTPRVHNDWNGLQSDLEKLAQVYAVSWRWEGGSPVTVPVAGVPLRIDDKEVGRILHSLEQQSDRFRSSLGLALNKSRLGGTQREDDINAFVKNFYVETKSLRDHFTDHKSTGADVQSLLERAALIDQFMQRRPLSMSALDDWSLVKNNLDELARAYNVSWRWSGTNSPSSGPVVVDLPVVAIITSAGSTNLPDYRISLSRGGQAEVALHNSLTSREVPANIAERFFADLTAAMPLAQLPVGQPCFKSASFGSSTFINFANQRSPDLGCATGPQAQLLIADVAAIKHALNIR